MRLFYRVQTGRPLRVAWALEEIGVDYEPVALSKDQCRQHHPLGRVPALELDDGRVLFESTAIVLGGVLAVARHTDVIDAAPPRVIDYLDRLQARPAYVRALARTESVFAP